ncbi:hypothetical protein Rsub_11358 [Raphidocelis subcapitata]|uniref:START domain-containing protein n=1 Tax=Raphidocelis subcapitata TaxID=307507 RepID=A0A2V0PG57_9CHLO|nr:hypothetical protein Rsub_11358 [Raphidocelis subcapitata]|eukprot:GBF98776.1 hypothetical protein Rsub_11358 [Raphidocelis subcapitata]
MGCTCSKADQPAAERRRPPGARGQPPAASSPSAARPSFLVPRMPSSRSLASLYLDCLEQDELFEEFQSSCSAGRAGSATGGDADSLREWHDAAPEGPAAAAPEGGGGDGGGGGAGLGGRAGNGAGAGAPPSGLPPLERILQEYKQGDLFLCKAVGEVLSYRRAAGLCLDSLARELAAAEGRVDARLAAACGGDMEGGVGIGDGGDACVHCVSGVAKQQQAQGGEVAGQVTNGVANEAVADAEARAAAAEPGGAPPPSPRRRAHHYHHRRWAPTAGDSLDVGSHPLPPDELGCGGSHLFSAAHLMGHVRAASDLLDSIETSKGWRQVAWGALKIWHSHDKAAGLQHFRVHCVLEETVLNMLTMVREIDLAPTWNPALSVMRIMCEASLAEILIYMAIWLPWPLSEPEILVRALGVNLLSTDAGCMLMMLQDLGDDLPPGIELDPDHHRRTRYRLSPSCVAFVPLPADPQSGAPRLDTTVVATLDARRVPVPDVIISFLLKIFAPLVYRSVVHACARLFHAASADASPLLQRQAARSAFYLSQARAIDRHLAAKGIAPQMPLLRGLAAVDAPDASAVSARSLGTHSAGA